MLNGKIPAENTLHLTNTTSLPAQRWQGSVALRRVQLVRPIATYASSRHLPERGSLLFSLNEAAS
jgi:hypothetical protein